MKSPAQFTSIGGQAVIEGVMMRSPRFVAVAVRRPDRQIVVRNQPYQGFTQRIRILRKPLLRGVATLLESMLQGIEALSYSANVASQGEEGHAPEEKLSSMAVAGSIASAFLLAIGLFVALPHFLTTLLAPDPTSPVFHFVDGVLKMAILLAYVGLIALMKDIHRVFQYHGAEHKSIYAFEAGEELTVENARKYTTLHPRCGTSFLLFLVLISVAVFTIVFPTFGLTQLSDNKLANHLLMILVKAGLMFPVAGLAYEFIKMCACRMNNPLFRMMIWPGMILQKLTTREPTDDQLEIALASLRQVLRAEKQPEAEKQSMVGEFLFSRLGEIALVNATAAEFPEG